MATTTTYSKVPLSNSSYGKQILISGTASGSATLLHTTQPSGSQFTDECYIYAYNDSTSSILTSILWGGTNEPNDVIRNTIPSKSGRMLLVDGKILQNGLTVQAYAQVPNVITMDGFVNRIQSSMVVIDPRVTDWVTRIIRSGGNIPSNNTLIALTNFLLGMDSVGLTSKILIVNAFVPDSLVAATVPLLKVSTGDNWTNHNFVSGDLSVNGLTGDGSTKYLDTGFIPNSYLSQTSVSVIIYCTLAGSTGCTRMGAAEAAGALRFSWDNGSLGDYFCCYDTTYQGGVMNNSTYFLGYVCGTKISSTTRIIYEANSITPHYAACTTTGTDTGGHNTIPTNNLYCFTGNEGGTPSGFYPGRLSFAAVGFAISAIDSSNLFMLIQTLRQNLGGGYV
jgi:hypothetical protein